MIAHTLAIINCMGMDIEWYNCGQPQLIQACNFDFSITGEFHNKSLIAT